MRRQGITALTTTQALTLLDTAIAQPHAHLTPLKLETTAIQREFDRTGEAPALLRGLLRAGRRRASGASGSGTLRDRLSALGESERREELMNLVRGEAATVLGIPHATVLGADQVLKDLGMDSLMAVELRRRLSTTTGVALPATLAFDHPTPTAITQLLLQRLELTAKPKKARKTARTLTQADEPIAIVSMACRLPGGIHTPEAFWNLLSEGGDAISGFPKRWENLGIYDPDPEAAGKSYAREGGFLTDIEGFDAEFFGISPREAIAMDPQQRLVLETSWEALERAGIRPDTLTESRTGVYLGTMGSDYDNQHNHDLDALDGYLGTGNASSIISGRLSYTLGLQGPALTVDTACSSSLVAMHLAINALRTGECELALAGGVTVMSTPTLFVEFSRLKGMATDGRCKSFSDDADGAGWSEGVGILALKRLSDAQRDGDNVLAVIKGSAVNQDGRSQGLTAPNGPAQQRVVHDALSSARLTPADIDAVEAHGTGTPLGDPIEAGALTEIFGPGRAADRPLYLGSSKSNIGHAQAAAGVTGVIKMILALQHQTLPKTLHAEAPSSHIEWDGSGLELLQDNRPWQRGTGRIRRAGISSFGLSGTNAHVILEEAPESTPVADETAPDGAFPLPLLVSARTPDALRAQAGQWAAWLAGPDAAGLPAVAATSALHRTHFDVRAAILASSAEEATQALRALASDSAHPDLVEGQAVDGGTAILFTGQGSQYPGMGAELYETFPVFRQAFDEVCAAVDPHLGRSLADVVFAVDNGSEGDGHSDGAESAVHRTEFTQPGLFAHEVALYRLLESWGVTASAVSGHSIGELAAIHVAGVIGLEDAARLVVARGRLMQGCRTGGAMVSVEAAEDEVRAVLADAEGHVCVAALNSPSQTVLSGDSDAVRAVAAVFADRGRRTRELTVSHAFHSGHMDAMLEAFAEVAARCRFDAPRIPVVDAVSGRWSGTDTAAGEGIRSPEHWVRQVREAVRFTDVVATLRERGFRRFLECGPAGVLSAMGTECVGDAVFVAARRKGEGEARSLRSALGRLHVAGHAVDWTRAAGTGAARADGLPTYAFQHERYWLESTRGGDVRGAGLQSADHPWLTATATLAGGDGHLLSGRLSSADHPWLAGHAVFDSVLLPGTGLLDLAFAAARTVGAARVAGLTLARPLVLRDDVPVRLQVRVGGVSADGRRPVAIHSQPEDTTDQQTWTLHAEGELDDARSAADGAFTELSSWPVPGAEPVGLTDFYDRMADRGVRYGPEFRGLAELSRRGRVAYGRIVLPQAVADGLDVAGFGVHPALFDAALHALAGTGPEDADDDAASVLLPFAWTDVELYATGSTELRVRVELTESADGGPGRASVLLADATGAPVALAHGLDLQRATAEQLRGAGRSESDHLYRVEFQPVAPTEPAVAGSGADAPVVLGADGFLAAALGAEVVAGAADLARMTPVPRRVVVDRCVPGAVDGPSADRVLTAAQYELELLQGLLADPALADTEFVWVTGDAIGVRPDDVVVAPELATVWGLVRTARAEYPERVLRLLDVGADARHPELIAAAVADTDEPELALRGDTVLAARLTRAAAGDSVPVPRPQDGAWALDVREKGRLDTFTCVPVEQGGPLGPQEVRVQVRAAGLNFRDVLNALDMVHAPKLGLECAGVVLEAGPGVSHLRVGDRVMGLAVGSFGTEVRADARVMVRIPDSLTFAQAATVPLTFLTAYRGLVDLGGLRTGEKVLVHAAAGGVGMAAVQLAQHLGAEVYGTASPGKWDTLHRMGLDDTHIAHSRNTHFETKWADQQLDVVLNSLAHEFVDASLRLLPEGGRFLEMGKTDIRDATDVATTRPGVHYQAFDLMDAGPERIQELLQELTALFEAGAVEPLPFHAYDVREAPSAFRFMAQGRHTGKIVLTVPRPLDPQGTILITGGTGELGQQVAQRLVQEHGARHLLLTSRRGPNTPGTTELRDQLRQMGAESVDVRACDIADPDQSTHLLTTLDRPLTAVIHLAGIIDDGLLTGQNPQRLATVFAPKATGATHLHELTKNLDLTTFVLFSSAAGTLGSPGQSTYGAANAYLDALAAHRRAHGQPALSLAWGLWEQNGTGMTAHLTDADLARMRRGGAAALTTTEGLDLLDTALTRPEPQLTPVKLDLAALQQQSELPPLYGVLVRPKLRQAAAAAERGSEFMERLAALGDEERLTTLTEFVRVEAAAAAGLAGTASVTAEKPLKELGLDSLMSVELKNRISRQTGTEMPSTLAFDYPTPKAIAAYLHRRLDFGGAARGGAAQDGPPQDPAAAAQWALAQVDPVLLRESGLLAQLIELARRGGATQQGGTEEALQLAGELTDSEIDQALDAVLGDIAA
ncbi:SDR family NAD(P)-dependent oxidoreductase [Streptomyces sp. NPDC032198]|uniref:SDR family NAD(P)-dependent oxidoreductase n=1 Tax=Streptomyces sp. NPDC032198 TaxID=3155127 RepID=UPI003405989C